ncbi:MAG: GTP-binding protein [Eubacterium sp.]|nr:GTP-binding protein [Eubacterium sp.]
MIKLDLITGFLGSGKTTFIKRYAKFLMDQGLKVGILENDFGAINIDSLMLNDLQGDGCEVEMVVACPGAEAHMRRYKTKLIELAMLGLDRVIVEPSGLYDVDEFFDVLYEEPLSRMYEVGSVIAILDAMLEDDLSDDADYYLVSELARAGAVLVSHAESEEAREHIPSLAEHINHAMEKWKCERRFQAGQLIAKNWEKFTEKDFCSLRDCSYQGFDYQKNLDAADRFQHFFYMTIPFSAEESLQKIRNLMETDKTDKADKTNRYGNIFRIKGYLAAEDSNPYPWLEVNATRDRIAIKPSCRGQNVIIVIGENLDKAAIDTIWKGAVTV